MLSYEFPPIGGGGSRVVAGLTKELAADGWDVDLVTMEFPDLARREEIAGALVNRVPCRRRQKYHCTIFEAARYALAAVPTVQRLLKERQPDLVHAHFIFPDGLIAWLATRRLGIPYVITAHGSDVPGYNAHRLKFVHRMLAPLWRAVVKHAAVVVCPSLHLKKLVDATGVSARTIMIPNGFDTEKLTPRRKAKRILVVTRMLERKGIQYVLEALDGQPLDFEIDIVGDGPYLPTLKSMAAAKALPVRFWGWLDNDSPKLKSLYETASIYVLPSENENFPVGLLEAMSAGAAIVTTKGTGCEEVVGDAAWLIAPRDVAGLRTALQTLMRDPACCRAYGERARERLETHFSWNVVVRRYDVAYRQHMVRDRMTNLALIP